MAKDGKNMNEEKLQDQHKRASKDHDGADTTKSSTPLFDIPQELLDEIFELAYPIETNFKIATRRDWESNHKRKQKLNGTVLQPTPFVHKVNDWMVSKRYFRMAARAWFVAQSSYMHGRPKLDPLLHMRTPCGLFLKHTKRVSIHTLMPSFNRLAFAELAKCRSVRVLSVKVPDSIFDEIENKFAWISELSDDELTRVIHTYGMGVTASLEELQISPIRLSQYIRSDAEWDMFGHNLKRLERLVWNHKLEGACVPNEAVLYCGSQVRYGPQTPPAVYSVPNLLLRVLQWHRNLWRVDGCPKTTTKTACLDLLFILTILVVIDVCFNLGKFLLLLL